MPVLIPALIAVTVMTERFSDDLAMALTGLTITAVDTFRRRVLRIMLRRLGVLVGVTAVSSVAMILVVRQLPWLIPVGAPNWLFPGALGAYGLLAITMFCAQILFVLCRPATALVAMSAGLAVFVAVGVPLAAGGELLAGPLVGFCAGAATAAALSLALTVRTARRRRLGRLLRDVTSPDRPPALSFGKTQVHSRPPRRTTSGQRKRSPADAASGPDPVMGAEPLVCPLRGAHRGSRRRSLRPEGLE